MSNLSDWASRFRSNVLLFQLEKYGETTGLYKTQEKYGSGVPCFSFTSPVYHVWLNDRCVLSCGNYSEALKTYERGANKWNM